MNQIKSLLFIVSICVFTLTDNTASGQILYGFTQNCFVKNDIKNNIYDTLIEFPYNRPYALNSTIDRYNGYYYCCGKLPGQYGYFHVIDLISNQITSYPYMCYRLEYDMVSGRVLCEGNDKLYSFDIETKAFTFISDLDSSLGEIGGEIQSYLPHSNQFYYTGWIQNNDSGCYTYFFDLSTKAYQCSSRVKKNNNMYLIGDDMVTNDYNDDLLGHHNGYVGIINPCKGEMNIVLTIQDYEFSPGGQMAVFDHTSLKYIVPYISKSKKYKYALIDIYNNSYILIDQGETQIGSQQIYEKPQPPIIFRNDTLYVPKGIKYDWYLNDSFIISTNTNYYVPKQSGIYKAFVHFREYEKFSKEAIITISHVDKGEKISIKIYPQPANDKLTIEFKNNLMSRGKIINQLGKNIMEFNFRNTITLPLEGVENGLYYVIVHSKNNRVSKRIIKL